MLVSYYAIKLSDLMAKCKNPNSYDATFELKSNLLTGI